MGPGLRREDAIIMYRKMNEDSIPYAPIERVLAPIFVTLPDGKRLEFSGPVTGCEIAAAIGPGLAKAAIAFRVDGRPRDLATVIDRDAAVAIITRDSAEGLEILRHDAAHVMAEAVKELYPTPRLLSARRRKPVLLRFRRAEPFTPDDLEKIESADARHRAPRREDHPGSLERDGSRRLFSRSRRELQG